MADLINKDVPNNLFRAKIFEMDNKALTQWIRDYANIKPNQVDNNNDDDEEDDEDEEEPSWFEDDGKIPVLDLDWWARDRDVSKHIPKLTTIILGQIIKTVNYLATSGDLDQLDKLKAIMPSNLIPAIQSQLSFTALRNFLKLPLSQYFDRTSIQLETVIGCIKQEEDVYRYLYHYHPTHPFLSQTENQLLLNVFENYELFTKGEIDPYQYPVVEVGMKVLPNLNDHEPIDVIPDTYAINNREKFQERWNELTGGVLQHVNWTNVFAAGGSILHCLRVMSEQAWKLILRTETEDEMLNADQFFFQPFSNIEYEKGEYKSTDIDLYIYGLSIEQTRAKIQEIFESITKVDPKATFAHEGPTVTIYGPTFKPIQIILCLHKSPAEVLLHYDLNCVCVGYNGNEVMCLPKFVIGMKYKMNFLDSSMNTQDKFQITRLYKYRCRGYSTSLPLHFRMHGYFDQEIPSNEELAKDPNHPVYYFICMILHIAKWRFMKDNFKNHPLGVGYGVWRWERFWTSGMTLGQRRQPGPKKNNVLSNNDQEIPLPIDENQDLVVYTKQLQKTIWTEPMTRYFEINHALDGMFNDSGVEKEMTRLTETLEELEITSYNDNPYLQHFYLNCCVKTKTHTPDLSKFDNPYLGLNTSVARVMYDNASKKIALNIRALEAGRVLSDPIDVCGRRWQLVLESGPAMPIVFMHLKLLPESEPRDPFSSMDQAPILAANFIIKFKGHSDPINTIEPRDLAIDGSKIFNDTSDTWSTYFHGTYISAKAANPLNIRCDPNERSNCIVDDSITIQIIVQTLTVYTPAIAF